MSHALHLATTMCQVRDMTRSVAFYRDVVGCRVAFTSPEWTSMTIGETKLGLHPLMKDFQANIGGWILGYAVDDIQDLKLRLLENDVKILQDFHDVPGGVVLMFADPDGNLLQAIQEGASTAKLGV